MTIEVNKAIYDEDHSQSIINLNGPGAWTHKQGRRQTLYQAQFRFIQASCCNPALDHVTSVKLFRAIFGKPQVVRDYSCRNHVWTFREAKTGTVLHVLVSVEGPSFQYDNSRREKVSCASLIRIMDWITKQVWAVGGTPTTGAKEA